MEKLFYPKLKTDKWKKNSEPEKTFFYHLSDLQERYHTVVSGTP